MKQLDTRHASFAAQFDALLQARTGVETSVAEPVRDIIAAIRTRGDDALFDYTTRFDRLTLNAGTVRIAQDEIAREAAKVAPDLMTALHQAAGRIESFHRAQVPDDLSYTDDAGLTLGMRWNALDAVGLYVPGGKAAYPSSVLMNALPAKVAGVSRIAMCVPCPDGVLNPLVLAAAQVCGVSEIYRVGGAQAVAALAYGTASIAPVDRIVGPGNAYVAEAKRQVFGHVGIDSIAGPSEVLVIADSRNTPRFVALDLLAQAEHDELAQAVLVTDDETFAQKVIDAVELELRTLPRAKIAQRAWADHGAVIVVRDWNEAAEIANRLAPEHLEIMLDDPQAFAAKVRHAGAMFLGRYCPEAVGDYVGGPNHVLPTSRTARFASGLSVFDFLKRTTSIATGPEGLKQVGPTGVALAKAEGLDAHALSLSTRLEALGA
ncbi:histidinol dehydrogenase [Neoasaia chiangmaiensis NBRC 101099]|uniref:Histidinol dehydrogenase n=1 Tax=Neoasaia chiangmaiensis TaxID=320497 RepID=A0A1U9KS86_9PROT|nr:histidinol dehydrogenase [Neoasaia chiangmaiensis]AQS88686.1 histidinol dehydrogenase [Neoasaia chiangmaiensis]GBR41040.1 histidinol dehydrogenase [Neoasaia chiangmaiensis NBRC 101099]GEN13636.1 histidinol dehydrogenase [Neoasaia chiangmaiensis]